MEALIPTSLRRNIDELISIASRDEKAELEVKVLAGQVQTKDVADRIVAAIESVSTGGVIDTHRATFAYPDGLRVTVEGADNIFKVCSTASFRGVPLSVERKQRYFDAPTPGGVVETKASTDVVDVPDLRLRFTLRHEQPLRKDFSGAPMDPAAHVRIYHRKSWKTSDGILQVDMSLVKTRLKHHKSFGDVLKQTPSYEVEIEVINREATTKVVGNAMIRVAEAIVAAYQQSPFILTVSDLERYRMEFDAMRLRFVNPVTMERRHVVAGRPHNILSGYTVTNKADGERCFLVVARDKRVLRWTKDGKVAWTGLSATKDIHIGDVVDGEYLADRNLFCIFDVYNFRGKSTLRLPLMTSDDDVTKEPLKSRLGCAHLFVEDLRKDFAVLSARTPLRVETKLFLAGDGAAMEQAIKTLLDTQFEYPTDGLIFTPRASPVAPVVDRKGDTWLRVYKWKPASQNSIDFLVSFKKDNSYDPVLGQNAVRGTLFVSRSPGSDIVYPCETMTGEYVRPELPPDLRVIAETRDRAPSPFQPTAPKAPTAYEILIPIAPRGYPVDVTGAKVEDNTIIECVRDVEHGRWNVLRTRYDKTYQYRVRGEPQFGNDINTAESIWTNIHNPVTEEMLRMVHSSPPSDTFEDELYYRDTLEAAGRVMRPVMDFHNRIKEEMYRSSIRAGDNLLELAMGRANDLHKWRKTRPAKVVGVDLSSGNLEGGRQGACVRYLKETAKQKLPPALFIVGDMSVPLMEQDNRYLRILDKREPAPTEYLAQFAGLTEFDVISCQMAMHYACESEEKFRSFVGNLTRHGKGIYFGTCMDGQAVYSLLLGKKGHIFRQDGQVFGEMTKEYADGEGWTEEFGKAIVVKLESFEKPEREYLVPFGKVTEILRENNYELVGSTMFSENYASQTETVLTGDLQAFSFLHRGFVFKRVAPPKKEPEEAKQEVEVPVVEEPKEAKKEEANDDGKGPEEKPKKRKLVKIKVTEEPAVEPVFFFAGNPALNETRYLTNMYEAPVQVEGTNFPTVEHYFQWAKAKQFGDAAAQAKILKTASAKSVKAYGKKVVGFDEDAWDEKRVAVMKAAVKAKFMQHPDLLKKLRETGDRPLAEADPRGKFWGIGTSADTSKAKDPAKWPGKNMLGNILMELRAELKE